MSPRFSAISCRFKSTSSRESAKPLIERFRQIWTPDVRILGPDGFEYVHWNGYLPPMQFVSRLLVGEGETYLRMHDFDRATSLFEEVVRVFPTSEFAPEAQYWLAVAAYRKSDNGNDLREGWARLRSRYPESIWRVKQSFTENP